jgi:hypothetical protein
MIATQEITHDMDPVTIREELGVLKGRIQVLEWDKSRKQINPAKQAKLSSFLKRREELVQKLEELV